MDDEKTNQGDEERPRIKVTDRRKFATDGTLRPAQEAAAPPPAETETSTPPSDVPEAEVDESDTGAATDTDGSAEAPPERAAPASPDEETGLQDPPADEPRITDPQPGISELPRDFAAFVETMYLEAMLYMGAIADPRTGEVVEDPELAKYKIDLLIMLQEKTEGNLTAEEKAQLHETLYQLRMLYLQKTKTATL